MDTNGRKTQREYSILCPLQDNVMCLAYRSLFFSFKCFHYYWNCSFFLSKCINLSTDFALTNKLHSFLTSKILHGIFLTLDSYGTQTMLLWCVMSYSLVMVITFSENLAAAIFRVEWSILQHTAAIWDGSCMTLRHVDIHIPNRTALCINRSIQLIQKTLRSKVKLSLSTPRRHTGGAKV